MTLDRFARWDTATGDGKRDLCLKHLPRRQELLCADCLQVTASSIRLYIQTNVAPSLATDSKRSSSTEAICKLCFAGTEDWVNQNGLAKVIIVVFLTTMVVFLYDAGTPY